VVPLFLTFEYGFLFLSVILCVATMTTGGEAGEKTHEKSKLSFLSGAAIISKIESVC